MIETISQAEAVPEAYPAIDGVTGDALAVAWQRIEAYTAFRFSARSVVWTVEGHGDWCPPLAPLEITAEDIWQGGAWQPATVFASPHGGYRITQAGTYRFTGTLGAAPVPAAVAAAVKRLADYMAEESLLPAGMRSYSANVGQLSETVSGDPARAARALQNSGAADLLRPYRRV